MKTFVKSLIVPVLLSTQLTGCLMTEREYQEKLAEERKAVAAEQKRIADEKAKEPTAEDIKRTKDIEILTARKFIADFDSRIIKVQDYVSKCLKESKATESSNNVEVCTTIAYDMYNFYRDGNNIDQRDKAAYRNAKELANQPLSTELE